MELENVLKLINAVSKSELTSFTLEDGDTKLSFGADRLDKTNNILNKSDIELPGAIFASDGQAADRTSGDRLAENELADDKLTSNTSDERTADSQMITSPLVGIFYSAEAPEAEDYVSVGDTVKKGQVIGIIEAMKLMNEIKSDYDGIVTKILVNNEQLIEYGQPMFVIEPV